MPLPYSDVLTQWDRSRAFGDPRDLPTFSAQLNEHTGTNDYDEGLRDNWWRRASTRADINFFNPIAASTTEPVGRAIGGLFGGQGAEIGANVGRSIPRTAAQVAAGVGAAFIPGVGEIASPLLLGSLFGGQTYAETGSAKAGLISGATAGILPGVANVARPLLP